MFTWLEMHPNSTTQTSLTKADVLLILLSNKEVKTNPKLKALRTLRLCFVYYHYAFIKTAKRRHDVALASDSLFIFVYRLGIWGLAGCLLTCWCGYFFLPGTSHLWFFLEVLKCFIRFMVFMPRSRPDGWHMSLVWVLLHASPWPVTQNEATSHTEHFFLTTVRTCVIGNQ